MKRVKYTPDQMIRQLLAGTGAKRDEEGLGGIERGGREEA
jgi:hypothetical protein